MAGYTITNLTGDFIKDKDLFGAQDPYVIFELPGEHDNVSTKVVKSGGINPVWDESYTLPGGLPGEDILIKVYNKNTLLPDQLLGKGVLSPSRLSDGQQRVQLYDKKGKESGELIFTVSGGSGMGGAGYGTDSYGTGTGMGAAGAGAGAMGTNSSYNGTGGAGGVHDFSAADREAQAEGALEGGQIVDQDTDVQHRDLGNAEEEVATTTTTRRREKDIEPAGVCDVKTFTKVEDRPEVRERKEYILEHHPHEKEFIVETKFTGKERELVEGRQIEHLGTEERIVETAKTNPCAGAADVAATALPGAVGAGGMGGAGYGSTGTTGTGMGTGNTGMGTGNTGTGYNNTSTDNVY